MYNQGYTPVNNDPQYPSQYSPYSPYPQNGNGWYAPAPANQQPQAKKKGGGGKGGGGGRGKKRGSFKWQLIKFLLVLVFLAGAAGGIYLYKIHSDVKPYTRVFLDNISVDGIDLGGKTWEEGSAAVWNQANTKQNSWYVRLKNEAGEYKDITAQTLGIRFDPSAALEQAWAIGHDTNVNDRKTVFQLKDTIERMKNASEVMQFYSAEESADTAPIDTILNTLERAAFSAPQNAVITGFNPDDTANPFTFLPERMGYDLDTDAVKGQILEMVQTFQSGEITLAPRQVPPEVTVADLQKTVSLLYRAKTPIDKHSTDERNENIRVAFKKINGLRVTSGSRFSFNKIVGKRSKENGFFEANEYAYGELVVGVGGGVCQASTTVYLAAIQSGMTIVERKPHGNPVSYTALGQDATVSDTKGRELDFVFKNSSPGDIFLTAHVIPDPANKNRLLCEVRIYGQSLENISYRLETKQLETIPIPEPIYEKDKTGEHVTFMDEEKVVSEGKEGYKVETYLITLQDGNEVGRKLVSTDTYPARAPKIYVGVAQRF